MTFWDFVEKHPFWVILSVIVVGTVIRDLALAAWGIQ